MIDTIDKGLAAPQLYERDPATAAELSKKRARAVDLLAEAERRWLASAEELERRSADPV